MDLDFVIAPLWSAIAGGGLLVGILSRALVEQLRRTFATREDLDRQEERLEEVALVPLQRTLARLDEVRESQATHAALLEHLQQRVERMEEVRRG